MFILFDTCVLLMLLRIAPDMLADQRFNCWIFCFRSSTYPMYRLWELSTIGLREN